MDVLLARVAKVMSECSRFWGCDVLDTVDRVIFNLEEINRELCGYMQILILSRVTSLARARLFWKRVW